MRPHFIVDLPLATGFHKLQVFPHDGEDGIVLVVVIEQRGTLCQCIDLHVLQALPMSLCDVIIDTTQLIVKIIGVQAAIVDVFIGLYKLFAGK